MDPICISAAAILRCTSLTQVQNIAFIVPAALEFLASCMLIFLKWGSGRQHLLLAAEGWAYFILASLELLTSILPALSDKNVDLFRRFDIGIGIGSFLPLLLYTLYLYLFTRKELLSTLPKYVINVANVTMFLSVPAIIATNEVASVSGITISFDSTRSFPSFIFSSADSQFLWLLFTALSLAILMAYQATVFGFSFFRFIWILVQNYQGKHDVRVGGIGWFSAGLKLGALEAIIGFAGGGFEISMTRRVMRFIGRACLCIGLIIGVEPVTQRSAYDNFEKVVGKPRRPQLQISNPRLSTFRQLSPTATKFHSALSATVDIRMPHYLTFSQRQKLLLGDTSSAISSFISPTDSTAQARVTVYHDAYGGPPSLHMRFSALAVPSLTDIVSPTTPESGSDVTLSDQTEEPFRKNTLSFLHVPPFAQSRQSTASSYVTTSTAEIIDVPIRTISQRRAEARVVVAKEVLVERQESIPEADETGDSDSRLTNPELLITPTRDSHDETSSRPTHAPNQSLGGKSVADSLQAVHELAGQFPSLPPSPRLSIPSNKNSLFVRAMGSVPDLRSPRARALSPPRASRYKSLSPRSPSSLPYTRNGRAEDASASELYGKDILWTPRQEPQSARPPSSSYSDYSTVTIKPSNQPIAVSSALRDRSQSFGLDSVRFSHLADDSFDAVVNVHERILQSLEISGDSRSLWRRFSATGPEPIEEEAPTPSTYTSSTWQDNVGPMVAHRRSDVPADDAPSLNQ